MMRLIDADAMDERFDKAIFECFMEKDFTGASAGAVAKAALKFSPTVDAVPVVRCRDCKYGVLQKMCSDDVTFWCNTHCRRIKDAESYCSWARRRKDAGCNE